MSYTAVAVDEAGAIGGYVSVVRNPWMASGHFWSRVIVDPTLRHRGLGERDHYAEQRAMHNGFTGVLRTYRGRHLALALKLLSISVAQSYNIDYLYTNNDSTNAPMLAINRRLGYQASPGILMFIRVL